MTVQAGIEVETDLEVLVGEMEAPPCESAHHADAKSIHDNGAATHYVQSFHPCNGPIGMITVRCAKAAAAIQAEADHPAACHECGDRGPLSKFIIVLCPINSSTR